MNNYKLYTVSWSQYCSKAESLLNEADVPFEKIVLDKWDLLAAAARDIGIRRLPALEGKGIFYEGLSEIIKFLEDK